MGHEGVAAHDVAVDHDLVVGDGVGPQDVEPGRGDAGDGQHLHLDADALARLVDEHALQHEGDVDDAGGAGLERGQDVVDVRRLGRGGGGGRRGGEQQGDHPGGAGGRVRSGHAAVSPVAGPRVGEGEGAFRIATRHLREAVLAWEVRGHHVASSFDSFPPRGSCLAAIVVGDVAVRGGLAQGPVLSPRSIVVNPIPRFEVDVWLDKDQSGRDAPAYRIGENRRSRCARSTPTSTSSASRPTARSCRCCRTATTPTAATTSSAGAPCARSRRAARVTPSTSRHPRASRR